MESSYITGNGTLSYHNIITLLYWLILYKQNNKPIGVPLPCNDIFYVPLIFVIKYKNSLKGMMF